MSILPNASHVAISGGNWVAIATGSTVTVNQGSQAGLSSAFKDLSAAAAHTALHDSAARFDAPRCHQNTRAKYRGRLELWMLGQAEEFEGKQLMWVHGGAGAGKSAIMQSVVEQCAQHGTILGSFFFSRGDPSRNYAEALIPTLAYQLARSFPAALTVLEPVIHRDPLIFKASLFTQAYELLVRPILYLCEHGIMDITSQFRRVFVIDGLDECSDPQKQALIIRVIASVLHDYHIPVCFLVASRPEIAISSAFEREKRLHDRFATITLDNDNDAQSDIRQFIVDSFLDVIDTHPLRHYIQLPWPDNDSIDNLVLKSSAHFIYAATAMKYIASPDEHPPRALKVVEGLESSRTGSPFAELDELYMHILTSARHGKQVLEILRHRYLSPFSSTVAAVCYVHNFSPHDISLFLSDVQSLVSLAPNEFSELCITPKHASLGDFFLEEARSQMLHISWEEYCTGLLARYFQLLDNGPRTSSFRFQHYDHPVPGQSRDLDSLIYALVDGITHSKDVKSVHSLISSHAPRDIWNFCLGSFADYPTISPSFIRSISATQAAKYMCAIQDSIHDDSLYFDQFKSYIDLLLDDLNGVVQQKPRYRVIPALMFSGGKSALFVACEFLRKCNCVFRIDEAYRLDFWWPLIKYIGTRKIYPRAFKAIRSLPQCQLSWGSDLAIAMKLALRRLMSLPWRGPSHTLRSSKHRQWLRRHKPLKQVSLGSPKLSSSLVMANNRDGHPYPEVLLPRKPNNLLSRRSRIWKQRNYDQRKKCAILLKTIIHYLYKSDHTSEVFRLARRPLPIAAQWYSRLLKRARYEMDAYVDRCKNLRIAC